MSRPCVLALLFALHATLGVQIGWGGGNCAATPASDGRFTYVWHGETGVLACVDPEGKRRWARFQHPGPDAEPGIYYHPKGAGVASSLALAGKHIHVTDNRGATIVFEPGRTYRQVARNQIEHFYTRENTQEVMNSTPIFEGTRMYYRGYQNLYCIGDK
ncbi:hypothetical protein HQ560_16145 [bacterium]|nr:hypothetical protein [bacterium]